MRAFAFFHTAWPLESFSADVLVVNVVHGPALDAP